MLIDGSWSIGPKNFNKIQNFLFGVVRAFSINATGGVHVAVAQYSDDARTEFRLNEHVLKENVREAIDNIPYKGGNTATGRAINYAREVMFAVENGARPGASRKLILLTDGESILDDVEIPARKLRNSDVEIFTIGVGHALQSELEMIASSPVDKHVIMIDSFDNINGIRKRFLKTLCKR